jgi:hypothetical protein
VRRQRRHADQLAERRRRFSKLADQVLQVEVILPIVAKILAVQQLQLIGHLRVIAAAQDRRDNLLGLEVRELPFLPHIERLRCLRPDDEHQPIAPRNGIANLLVKRQRPARHRHAIEPYVEPRRLEIAVQARDKRPGRIERFTLICAGVREEDGCHE